MTRASRSSIAILAAALALVQQPAFARPGYAASFGAAGSAFACPGYDASFGAAGSTLAAPAAGKPAHAQDLEFLLFERYLDSLRQQAGIPGLSAVIVKDGGVAWERGFGYQDLEGSVAATPITPYLISDLTQTFASVLLMQCVEQRTLGLDDPLSRWSMGTDATIAQVLAHVTSATASSYRYDPTRFALLTAPVDACGSLSARTRVAQSIFDRLGMIDSVPGRDVPDDRYGAVLARLAIPYRVDRRGRATRSEYPPRRTDASTGLVSSARDLAKYDAALDDHILLHADTLATMWSNPSRPGNVRPTGLGWFVQTYNGERLVWHFGYVPDAFSSLILKVPARRLTLILLANSDGLSAPFDLAQGDVSSSVFAVTFLRLFL